MISDPEVYKMHQWIAEKLGIASMLNEGEPAHLDRVARDIRLWQIECRRFGVTTELARKVASQIIEEKCSAIGMLERFLKLVTESRRRDASDLTDGPRQCALCLGTGFATVFDHRDRRLTASVTCSCALGAKISDQLASQPDPVKIDDARQPEVARQVREYQRYINDKLQIFSEAHGMNGLSKEEMVDVIRKMTSAPLFENVLKV